MNKYEILFKKYKKWVNKHQIDAQSNYKTESLTIKTDEMKPMVAATSLLGYLPPALHHPFTTVVGIDSVRNSLPNPAVHTSATVIIICFYK